MYFKQKSNVIFRSYESFGYITDSRHFGYKQANNGGNDDIGDKIVSQSGAVFLSVLSENPQPLDDLVKKISMNFISSDIDAIKTDAREFYRLLELDGFIVSGETMQECNEKDWRFSYKVAESQKEKRDCSPIRSLEKSTQEFFDEYFKNEPQLTNLHIEITSKCNERCVHCYIPHDNKTRHIEPDLFYNILEQCKEMNLLHVTLSGGEPLMHNNFDDFLKKCNEYNFSVNVLSNLTLLNIENIEEMKRNRLLGVQVSLYSMDPNIHDAITQEKGSFEKTMSAIHKLKENDIPMQISCPILKKNMNCYDMVIEWGKANNIHVGSDFIILARYNHTTQNLSNRLSTSDVREILKQKNTKDPKDFEELEKEAEHKKIDPDDIVCSVCHSSICIADNGNVYPCAGWQDYVVGNVNEASLKDIWSNSNKVQYLRSLRKRDFPKCIQCAESAFCTMCMVRNANEHHLGDPLEVNEYFCNIAKVNRELVQEWKHSLTNVLDIK